MKIPAMLAALAALGLTIIPPVLVANGAISDPLQKGLMLAGAFLWFATAPLWIRGEKA